MSVKLPRRQGVVVRGFRQFSRMNDAYGPFVGPKTAAGFLGVSRQRVEDLMSDGKLTEWRFLGARLVALRELEERKSRLAGVRLWGGSAGRNESERYAVYGVVSERGG